MDAFPKNQTCPKCKLFNHPKYTCAEATWNFEAKYLDLIKVIEPQPTRKHTGRI